MQNLSKPNYFALQNLSKMKVTVIFSNKPSLLNKRIITFFNINITSLNKASLIFDFEIAHPSKTEQYIKRGIKNYPVLIDSEDNHTVGVNNVIKYLKSFVKNHNEKIIQKTDVDRIDEFWQKTMGNARLDDSGKIKVDDDDDDDEEGDAGDNLHHRIQEAFEKRNTDMEQSSIDNKPKSSKNKSVTGSHNKLKNKPTSDDYYRNNNLSTDETPADTLKNMRSNNKDSSIDDALMTKFFENQEESM